MNPSHVRTERLVVPQNVTLMVLKPKKGGEGYDDIAHLSHMDCSPPLPEEGKYVRVKGTLYRVTSIIHEYRWYQPEAASTAEAITEINIFVEDL